MDYQAYIKSELLILIPVLYVIGIGLKKSKLPDKWIPLSLGLVGIGLSFIWVVATCEICGIRETAAALFTAVTQGVLAAGASVYVHQLLIQSGKES